MPAGRPRTKSILNEKELLQLEALAGFGTPTKEIAMFFDMSKATLCKNYKIPLKNGRAKFSCKLRVAQARNALKGNATMQIWLGKQILNQADKFDVGNKSDEGFEFYNPKKGKK